MAVTFNNAQFNGAQASQGAIALGVYTGTGLTGTLGATAVTVNGTISAPGNHVVVDLNAAGLVAVGADSVYLGYSSLPGGHYEYYFAVPVVGLLTPVTIAVSGTTIPTVQAAIPVSFGSPLTDPTIPNDVTGPAFQAATINGATLTLTYGEALDATNRPAAGAFTVTAGGARATVNGVAVAGNTVVLTLAAPVASGQAVTVAYGDPTGGNDALAVQDVFGNDAASLGATVVLNATPDTTAPVFQSASVNGATLTLTYGEALDPANPPAAGTFAVTAGGAPATVSGVAVAGNTVVLTLGTPVANGQAVTVAYGDPTGGNDLLAVQDVAGNDAATLAATAVSNATPDTTAPVFQSAGVNGATLTLTYGEALDPANPPAAGAFAVTAGGAPATVSGVAVVGNAVVLTLGTPVANGAAVTVAYRDPTGGNDLLAVQDVAGNDAATLAATAVSNATPDTTAPVFQSASVNGATLTLNYSEVLDAAQGPLAGAFAVTAGGAPVTVAGAAVNGSSVVLTLGTPVASGQAVTVTYGDPTGGNDLLAVQDVVGNDAASLVAVAVVNATPAPVDVVPPVFQSANANGATLTLTYSEAVDPARLPAAGAFAVTAAGAPVAVAGIAAVGNTVVLTLGTPVASGQAVTVAYADPTPGDDPFAVQDLAGNDAAGLTATAVANTTPDVAAPVFQAAAVNGATLTLTYGEALDAANPPATTAFTVTAGGTPVAVTGVAVVGNGVALTLATPVASGQAVTVAYGDPTGTNDLLAIQDVAGNDAVTLAATAALNTTPDTTAPVFQAATVNGTALTLTYGEALDAANPPAAGAFTVTAGGAPVAVTGVAVTGNTVALTLGTAVASGQAVTVAYADPTGGNDLLAVQDVVGNDAATLAATAVVNATPVPADTTAPAFQAAAVNGTALTLTYSEALDGANPPAAGAFTVTAGGAPVAVSGVAVAGNIVALTLAAPVANGAAVTVAYADPTGGNDLLALQDLAGNDAAALAAAPVLNTTPDTSPPAFQTAAVSGATLTLTYGEALDAANPSATTAFTVTAGGVPVAVSAVAVSGNSVALTLATPVASGQAVTVAYGDPTGGNDALAVQDLIGNDAVTLAATAVVNATPVPPDTVAPAFLSGSVNADTVTLAYAEALDAANPPAAGAFAVTAGGAPATVSGIAITGNTVTLTLAAPVASGQAVTVAYTDPSGGNDLLAVQDLAGNDAATLPAAAIVNATPAPLDTAPPILQSAAVDGATLVLAYSEALDAAGPPPAAAFAVTADGVPVTVSAVAVSGNTVALTLTTPVASGQAVAVTYGDPTGGNDPLAIQDLAGNDAAGFAAAPVLNGTPAPIDTVAPVLLSGSANAGTVTLTYGEALDAAGPPAPGAFVVTADGAPVTVNAVAVAGNTVALTLATPVASGQAVAVTYTDPTGGDDLSAVQDLAGNDAADFATGIVNATPVPADATPPALQAGTVNGAAVTLTFGEALDGTNPPAATAFTVTADGAPVAVTGVAVAGNTVALALGTAVANGAAVTVAYADPTGGNDLLAIQDLAGNDAAAFAAGVVNATPVPADTTPPAFQAAAVNGTALTLTYGEALDAANPPATTAFTVTAGGAPVAVTGVAVAGNTVALTLGAAVANGQAVTVAYADPTGGNDLLAIQDRAGNDAADLVAAPVLNTTPDTSAPVFQSATVNGTGLTLTYGEALDAANPPAATSFTVTAGGAPVAVTGVAVTGNSVALTLGTAVANGQAVTVAYVDPTGGDDLLAVQDRAGNDAADLVAAPVLNTTPDTSAPVFQSATVNGTALTLTYGEALDAANPPAATAFTVTAGGAPVAVTGVAVTGNTVALTLGTAVANGAAVTVAYADPTGGNDLLAVQDRAGNDAADLVATPIVNATPDTTAPAFQSGSVNGTTVTLTYGEALDAANPPAATAFTVAAGGAPVAVTGVAVTGNTVALTLGAPVTSGQPVTVAYGDPTGGNDLLAVQDVTGNDAVSLVATPIVNATPDTTAPAFQSGSVNGTTVTLTYGEALDAANPPAATAFTVAAGGAPVAVTGVAVTGNTVALTLATPVASGAAVAVAYADPTSGDDLLAVQDLVGNDAANLVAVPIVNATPAPLDTTAPVFQSGSVDADTVTLTYGEALDAANPPAATAFAVTADGGPVTVTGVAVTGNTVALTLGTPVANGAAVTVAYADPTGGDDLLAVQDLAGNDAAALGATGIVNATPDTTRPVFRTSSIDGTALTLTYSEALDAMSPPPTTAFTVTADGVPVSVSAVAINGNTVALTLATPVANGQAVTLAYADPTGGDDPLAIQDLAGNDAAGLGATPVVNATPDTASPTFQSGSVNGAVLTLNYSEALDAAQGPAASAFTVTAGGAPAVVTAAAVNGSTVSLTLATPVANGQAVTLAYGDPTGGNDLLAIQDIAGNDAVSLAGAAIVNATPDTTAPVFQSASANGATLTLTYGEALDPANPPAAGAFAVTAGGAPVTVTGATVNGNTVALTLATPVANGQAVTVAYADPSLLDDPAAIQDTAGNDAATLGTTAAINTTPPTSDATAPVFQSANVDGASLTLTYGEALDAAHPPVAGDFSVTAGGAPSTITGVAVSGSTVTLTLATAVTSGQAVTVAYADPSGANDVAAIQDAVGNDAASLATTAVGNTTPAGGTGPGSSGGGGGTVDPAQGTPGTGGSGAGSGGSQGNAPATPGTGAGQGPGDQPGSAQQPTIGAVTGTTPPAAPDGTGLQTPATVAGTPVNSATPVVSGTATPGSTVTLYDTDGRTVLGVAAADAATGAYAITSAQLGEGTHVLSTTETVGGSEGLPSAPLTIDVDTLDPTLAFDPAITVLGPYRAILSGTVADPSGTVSVDVRTAGREVGSAAVAADGTWSITFRAGRSFVTGIEATAVDAAGNRSTAPSSYDLTFGIKGQPYRVTQDSYDPETAGYSGSSYFKRDGGELYHSTFSSRPNGSGAYTYTGGSFFDDKAYGRFTDVYDADGNIKYQSQYNNDGTISTFGQRDGITIPNMPNNTITAGAENDRFVFTPRAGQSAITDFQASGEGHDVIAFVGTGMSSLADVLRNTSMVGDDAVIHIGPTASVELVGVSKEQIGQAPSAFRFHD